MIKLDHIGFVVSGIKDYLEVFRALGFKEITKPVENPRQKVTASFVRIGEKDNAYVEILEPAGDATPISNFLNKKGGGLHHLCFAVDDLEGTCEDLTKKGFKMIVPPEACEAYDENFERNCKNVSKTAFFIMADRFLVELIEIGV